jgi:glucosamine 6-phosphate synthetase-like amidotransferase/phosphosugar isomerase protein
VSRDDGPVDPRILRTIAVATESRGRHSWGLAWIDSKGRMHCYKQSGRISDSLGILAMADDARLLIGHCRYATQGDPGNNLNNHPHPCDGGWIVHNGMIPEYHSLVWTRELFPVSRCDSEVLGLLIEQADGALIDRCTFAAQTATRSPLVLLGLWKPGRLVAVRNGNPLHLGTTKHGFYLASLTKGLPGKVKPVPDGEAIEFGEELCHV